MCTSRGLSPALSFDVPEDRRAHALAFGHLAVVHVRNRGAREEGREGEDAKRG